MSITRPLTVSLAALALFALSACGPGTPPSGSTPTPSDTPPSSSTPSPSATAVPATEPATVVVSALTLQVLGGDGRILVEVVSATSSANDAVAALSDVLGSPSTSTVAAGNCVAATTKYDWGGLILTDPAGVTAVDGSLFSILLTASASVDGVALEGPFGVTVGMTKAAVLAAAPGTIFNDYGSGFGAIPLDAGDASAAPDAWGTVAYLNSGIVSGIDSPVYHFGDC